MWKQKIGISIGVKYDLPMAEIIEIIAKTGFDSVSPTWQKEHDDLKAVVDCARAKGLEVQAMHAPFTKSADMWLDDGEKSRIAREELIRAVEDCASLDIAILVCHVWIGFEYTQTPNENGFRNYQALVDKARELGVKIAFENTEGEEFLYALMEYFKGDSAVGFCWDSGHEMCYNQSKDLLEKYGDVLLMTHLNDNLGVSRFDGKTYWTDDLHLLPYDGIADWQYNVERLKRSAHLDILNFELTTKSKPGRHENDGYDEMKPEVYYAEAYKRACRIAYTYSR